MKNKNGFYALLAIMLVFGMVVVGCGDDDDGEAKEITITGINKTGYVSIFIISNIEGFAYSELGDAEGFGNISNNEVTVSLKNWERNTSWTGSGSYYIILYFEDESRYFYSDGNEVKNQSDAVKYNISSASTTIAFDKFGIFTWEELLD